jgi:hypothetical protein
MIGSAKFTPANVYTHMQRPYGRLSIKYENTLDRAVESAT